MERVTVATPTGTYATQAELDALPELAAANPAEVSLATASGVTTLTLLPPIARLAVVARRTGDLTRSNTVTLAADPVLTVAVEANTTYLVDLLLWYASSQTADFLMDFTGPTGATFDWTSDALSTGSAASTQQVQRRHRGLANSDILGGVGVGSHVLARPTGILVVGSTAGSLTLRWAQNAAEVSDTVVKAGSALIARKLA